MSAAPWTPGDTTRRPTSAAPPYVLAAVERRQGGRYCVHCAELGLVTPPGIPLELDHRQPLARGGDNRTSNLQWLCRDHNRAKRDRPGPPKAPKWSRGIVRPAPGH